MTSLHIRRVLKEQIACIALLSCLATAMFMSGGCAVPAPGISTKVDSPVLRLGPSDLASIGTDETIRVAEDPVYQKMKRYRGVEFARFVTSKGMEPGKFGRAGYAQFICDDGYSPILPLTNLLSGKAFLATEDLDARTGEEWIPFRSHNTERDPGPVYLVWPSAAATTNGSPWPYGIVSIRIASDDSLFGRAAPQADKYRKGFELFRRNCMSCHSINGAGGTLGVDLNVPRNVYEYWQPGKLGDYVAHPENFRRNGKMPPFAILGPEAISEILNYVRYMRNHKAM